MRNLFMPLLLLGAFFGVSPILQADLDNCCSEEPCSYLDCCQTPKERCKFSGGIDYLYWKSQQDGLLGATTGLPLPPITQLKTLIHPDFIFESGYRLYAGFTMPCCDWEFTASYTNCPGRGNYKHISAPCTVTDANDQCFNIDSNLYSEFSGHWDSSFSYMDLDISQPFCLGKCFTLCPHAGFRAMWGNQKQKIDYTLLEPILNQKETAIVANSERVKSKQDHSGYGVEAGFWIESKLFCNISVIGHFGGSLLYGSFTNKLIDVLGLETIDTFYTFSRDITQQHIHKAIPSADYFLGLQYEANYCGYPFELHAGWESHVWFDLGNILLVGAENYTTQGLTLGLDVQF